MKLPGKYVDAGHWTDGTLSVQGVTENLAAKNYMYSLTKPSDVERMFHEMEKDYPPIINEILKGKELKKK